MSAHGKICRRQNEITELLSLQEEVRKRFDLRPAGEEMKSVQKKKKRRVSETLSLMFDETEAAALKNFLEFSWSTQTNDWRYCYPKFKSSQIIDLMQRSCGL